jgi:hypothetical protein
MGGQIDLTYTGAAFSGPPAFAEARVRPADIKYASIYDSFTITVLLQLEDLAQLPQVSRPNGIIAALRAGNSASRQGTPPGIAV